MPDDPAFEPIYEDIAAHHRTVVAHLAEPDSCWLPPNPANPDYAYYKGHPREYAYEHPEWPCKAAILAARDHLVAENPTLRVIGAHLGSMESDVDQIAQRFDRYPNFAVDTAARVPYFMFQPRDKVRAFLIKYQDRVLYGTGSWGSCHRMIPRGRWRSGPPRMPAIGNSLLQTRRSNSEDALTRASRCGCPFCARSSTTMPFAGCRE